MNEEVRRAYRYLIETGKAIRTGKVKCVSWERNGIGGKCTLFFITLGASDNVPRYPNDNYNPIEVVLFPKK